MIPINFDNSCAPTKYLPVQQGTKVEMFLNLKTAKVLGINVLSAQKRTSQLRSPMSAFGGKADIAQTVLGSAKKPEDAVPADAKAQRMLLAGAFLDCGR